VQEDEEHLDLSVGLSLASSHLSSRATSSSCLTTSSLSLVSGWRRDQALSSHCKPRPSREAGGTLASLHYTGRKSYPPPSTLAHSCRSSVLSRPSPPQSSTALLQVPPRAAPVALLPP
jgi:hypothetical protein